MPPSGPNAVDGSNRRVRDHERTGGDIIGGPPFQSAPSLVGRREALHARHAACAPMAGVRTFIGECLTRAHGLASGQALLLSSRHLVRAKPTAAAPMHADYVTRYTYRLLTPKRFRRHEAYTLGPVSDRKALELLVNPCIVMAGGP
jgi:hypothetical protein